MSAKRADLGSRDLISSLPDEVLGKILSSLPTNVAASTSVLSKRWRNLLNLVDNLDLNEASGGPLGFPEFMDKTLTLLRKSPTIKSLSLNFASPHDDSQMNTWIRTVMDCGGCLQLYLETAFGQCIDTEFFTSNTLLDLTICDYFVPDGLLPPGGVFFPSLKKLSLVSVAFLDADMYQHLISGCPVLEELFLHYNDLTIPAWNSVVSSPSIKRLTIFHHFPKFREPHEGCWIHTPGLLYLDYSSFVADQYEVDLGSLVEARLDIRSWERLKDDDGVLCEDFADDVLGNVTNLVAGISNVQTLHLSPDSLEVFHFCCQSMPVFHNLITLSFESDKKRAWQVVPLLLRNSPNLKCLAIKGLVHQVTSRCGDACACIPIRKKKKKKMEEGVCCLSTCQVKVLNISAYQGTCRELKQMRHFLGNLKCLETVNVCVNVNRQEDKDVNNMYLRITNALMELPRVSSNCRIHFF